MLESEDEMDKEAIIALARDKFGMGSEHPLVTVENVMEFAEAVSAAEREACAKVCEYVAAKLDNEGGYERNQHVSVPQDGCDECATMIRARSNAKLSGAEGIRA